MKQFYIMVILCVLLVLGGCAQKHQMDEEIVLTDGQSDTRYLPQSDARCEVVDDAEIIESFPLEPEELKDETHYVLSQSGEEDYDELSGDETVVSIQEPLVGRIAYGKASWYGKKFHGNKTANGERYNMYDNTAAHKRLPFNSLVKITSIKTGNSEIVRINDRGPYHGERIIDVSYAVAKTLGLVQQGVGEVKLEILKIGFDSRCAPHSSKKIK